MIDALKRLFETVMLVLCICVSLVIIAVSVLFTGAAEAWKFIRSHWEGKG